MKCHIFHRHSGREQDSSTIYTLYTKKDKREIGQMEQRPMTATGEVLGKLVGPNKKSLI